MDFHRSVRPQVRASVFDLFGITTDGAVEIVRTVAKGITMLDAKADVLHERVLTNWKLQKLNLVPEEIARVAFQQVDLMQEVHRRIKPTESYDYKTAYTDTVPALRQPSQQTLRSGNRACPTGGAEPLRVCRRLIEVSYAAMGSVSRAV